MAPYFWELIMYTLVNVTSLIIVSIFLVDHILLASQDMLRPFTCLYMWDHVILTEDGTTEHDKHSIQLGFVSVTFWLYYALHDTHTTEL